MAKTEWRFPLLGGGPYQGYTNNDIEAFKGQELIDNLAREICQNSLDEHLDGSDEPVRVVFELKKVKTDQYDVFSQYSECLEGCRKYWGEDMDSRLARFVTNAEKTLKEPYVSILVASDYNTKGLDGSRTEDKKSGWVALTCSEGVSVKNNENSAGSYGIGKNAPFACSALSMVFYNTIDQKNDGAFVGVAKLATILNRDGEPTQRVGKYQKIDSTPIFESDENDFRDLFLRTERGTDVIVVGFTETQKWVSNIAKAVLKNFFVAVIENKLIVELKDGDDITVIDSDTISQLFSDYSSDTELVCAYQLYNAFISPDCKDKTEVLEPDDVEVYIKSDSSYRRTIANFRETGMLVGMYYKRIYQHYAAVVIIRGKELGKLLRDTEPPRHNRWDYKQIDSSEKEKRKNAKNAIDTINNYIFQLLKSRFETIAEDVVDAAGVGEYFPDEAVGESEKGKGDDILKAKIKIGKIQDNHIAQGITINPAAKSKGTESNGKVNNKTRSPKPMPPKPPTKPVTPIPDAPNPCLGANSQRGTKVVSVENILAQRAFPINAAQGLYKIVIKTAEAHNDLFVECSAVGEDGNGDSLDIESFTYNSKAVSVKDGKVGALSINADMLAEFFVTFARKEKMMLKLHLTEVIKK
ncbi:MAG: hypothetical protein HDT21_02410 [Ruminococcus sp.]|nr:hypothetical protein [Ruminococcus sp.]